MTRYLYNFIPSYVLLVDIQSRSVMAEGKHGRRNMVPSITMSNYVFQRVDQFKYLEPTVAHFTDSSSGMKQILMIANRAFFQ